MSKPEKEKKSKEQFEDVDIVYVVWEDTFSTSGWSDAEYLAEVDSNPLLVHSIGFLLSHKKDHLVICPTLAPIARGLGDITRIPMGMVKECKVIKTVKKEKIYA